MADLKKAVEAIRSGRIGRLKFAPGRYDFWPDCSFEKHCYVSNNDDGVKRIAFLLEGVENLEIDGNGADFVFHGFLVPFVLDRCRDITLRHFSVDYARPFHSEGEIISVSRDDLTVRFSEEFPFIIENGELIFVDERNIRYPWGRLLEFDPIKREPAFMALDYWSRSFITKGLIPADEKGSFLPSLQGEDLGDRKVRIKVPGIKATIGNIMVFGPDHRQVPAVFLEECQNTSFSAVAIHHAGAMAFIAQRCDSVALENCSVIASKATTRVVSATADATHFVNCKGHIRLQGCRFESQMDDATNIHGNYATIHRILDRQTFEFRLMHVQHVGFPLLRTRETIAFSVKEKLHPLGQATTAKVSVINKQLVRVTVSDDLPPKLAEGDLVANFDRSSPTVEIRGCFFQGNRARGILLGAGGKTLVEGNVFHNPGAAILLEGDGIKWFEQAGVNDLTIRNNRFENCNFGVWGNAVIEISAPHIGADGSGEHCHRGITIVDNTFVCFDQTPLLAAKGADDLNFKDNLLQMSSAYPAHRDHPSRFHLEHCARSSIERCDDQPSREY